MNQETSDIKLLLFIGIAVMLLLFISFLLIFIFSQRKKYDYQRSIQLLHETQQNQLIEAAVRSEEKERHRIAEELHDEVGAFLSSSKLHFQGMNVNSFESHNKQLYENGQELLDEAIHKVRSISHNLHSNVLKELGLNEAIRHFTDKITLGNLIEASTLLDEAYTTQNPENDISIYRLVQELLNNILKHAHAKKIRLASIYENNLLKLTIVHNGKGLTQQQFEALRFKKEGLGLKNIQNRIILLKGKISFYDEPDGYYINVEIPVKSNLS
jgi:two-component system NarL family sensor kinase